MQVSEMRRELGNLYNGAAKWRALLAEAGDNQIIAIWYKTLGKGEIAPKPKKEDPSELIPKNKQLSLF